MPDYTPRRPGDRPADPGAAYAPGSSSPDRTREIAALHADRLEKEATVGKVRRRDIRRHAPVRLDAGSDGALAAGDAGSERAAVTDAVLAADPNLSKEPR